MLPYESEINWIAGVDNSGNTVALYNPDDFQIRVEEQILENEGLISYRDVRIINNSFWISSQDNLKQYEVGQFCQDEILELTFDGNIDFVNQSRHTLKE